MGRSGWWHKSIHERVIKTIGIFMKYTKDGKLEPGLHSMTADEFIYTFCKNGNRAEYEHAVTNIFDYAKYNGASRLIVGGSFVTETEIPHDLDCMMVFVDERHIPTFVDCAQMDNIEYDILYSSEQMPKSIDTYIKLMSTNDYGFIDRGVVEVRLQDITQPWVVKYAPNPEDMEIISRVYCERNIIERNKRRGILVVIHGLMTKAEWLSNLIPAVNSQGWIAAPYIYDSPAELLFNDGMRQRVVERFREWVYDLEQKYHPLTISVLCHSFGTYVITKYIEGFASEEYLPVPINSLILTGSIIRPDFDWNALIPNKVGRVLNVVADGDDIVKYMPEGGWKKLIGMDSLFGQGAIDGITNVSQKVENRKLEILTHTNIFKNDIIEQVFLPYLNANNGIAYREAKYEIVKRV